MKKVILGIITIIIILLICYFVIFSIPKKQINDIPIKVTITMSKNTKYEKNFTWHTKKKSTNKIQIIKAKNNQKISNSFKNNIIEYKSSPKKKMFGYYIHQVKVSNLKTGTKYYYRIGNENSWSEIGEFITDDGDNSFSFLYVADQQTNSNDSSYSIYTIKQAMKKNKQAEFLLNAGDLLNNPTEKDEWTNNLNFDIYGNLTTIQTAGNHDYKYTENGVSNSFNNHFFYDIPSQNKSTGLYYSLNYGNTHIVVLNTNSNWYGNLDLKQLNWLKKDLSSNESKNATFRIILMHRGVYTPGPHYYYYKDIQNLTNQLTSIIANYNVDLVFQGHDHLFALTYPLDENGNRDNMVISNNHIMENKNPIYFIGGTAGTKYEPHLIKENNQFILSDEHSYDINISSDKVNSYLNKFQIIDTPNDNNNNLSMFSNVKVTNNKMIIDSYTVDNQHYGKIKKYYTFGITKQKKQF